MLMTRLGTFAPGSFVNTVRRELDDAGEELGLEANLVQQLLLSKEHQGIARGGQQQPGEDCHHEGDFLGDAHVAFWYSVAARYTRAQPIGALRHIFGASY